MNKKGQLDFGIIMSPGFLILSALAVIATLIGYKLSLGMDSGGWPLWQLAVIIGVEVVASYLITWKMSE